MSLLLAAEQLGQRARNGWRPANGIALAFWDAEEFGLIGSTEWGEAHAEELRRHGLAYVNGDAVVSGLTFRASGTPGLRGTLRAALERVPDPGAPGRSLWDQWRGEGEEEPRLGLPGSGSDYTVFLHHLGLPVLDISFGGNPGGQYHTAYDDFPMMDRFLDPDWQGHETAGRFLAELLTLLAERGRDAFDDADAARGMARTARSAGRQWLPETHATAIAEAFEALASTIESSRARSAPVAFYRALETPEGLPDRPWYRNPLWAPGLETGYAAESFPLLRRAADENEEALAAQVSTLLESVRNLERLWSGAKLDPDSGDPSRPQPNPDTGQPRGGR